ncbi:TPA: hypothetical protein ACGX5P_002923 [Listeria monocytogenes]|uniref:hypothetical protein n=1 Tax=Listeria monocytogenes TaxID=1639 RepID=UPI000E6B9555|nr:hypothetical protein [Listeria monocytogenes]RJA01327.1 hypothetical protein D3C41_02650 [Listeria monocytogenes]
MKLKLIVFSPPYKKSHFYELMGPFFGDRIYRNFFPYLINSPRTVWYVIINEDREVLGFTSYEEFDRKVEIGEFYLSEKIDRSYYRRFLLRKVLQDLRKIESSRKIETVINCQIEKKLFEEKGFIQYRKTKNYYFLRREVHILEYR